VEDLGIRIAADESAHTDEDAQIRIEMGYQAIALKAIAKTLSMTLKIADVAHKNNVPCFCADLTVNPILVEWNKNVAARLSPFPDLGLGLLETNGHQNYLNWEKMISHHPYPDASWRKTEKGIFALDDDYYRKSGGIFKPSPFFEKLFQK
jgi:L-alanine-DL-glutamate epimerase-like enolase superfamily enzyme